MDIYRYFICFVIYGVIGWMYESAYYTLRYRRPVNTGFLNGCLCPIYGIGGLLIVALLGRIENTVQLFLAGMLLTCTLEYFVSWMLEEVFHTRWWDYSAWPFNIHGRVCLIAGLAFGTLSVLLIKFLHPTAVFFVMQLSDRAVYCICIITSTAILTDLVTTLRNSDKFEKRLWFVDMGPGILTDGTHRRQKRAVLQTPKIQDIIKRVWEYINSR